MSELPASVRLALWVTTAWRGELSTSDALRRSFPDVDHVAGDLARLDVWRDLGERALFVALPRPGDLSRMPRGSASGSAHAAATGECVFVAGLGGLLVPTLTEFGPEGDIGLRVDWTAYDADPVPRHRMEMLDLRQVERDLLERLRDHVRAFESVGGAPWGHAARAEAEAAVDTGLWGLPDDTPGRALRVMALAANASQLAHHASSLSALGSGGLDAVTAGRRDVLLRTLAGDADAALADATNIAVMALAGWRPA
ncbi:hypothetical protein N865_07970 [Intrasporangium oryzae NRRL B-24470]|uniref:Uncharacterized protein n=1 Tax=Intrasporangium oryzae NRRL B-24470 TaxID=1386089 RepID=W9G6H3_9MICO|nr:hypothetical protein [Intrasporangium oryzae]EWT01786.1 hypothetical protein N865_07970 [Intrasporangium oryzae NRRL B-24470]